MRWLRRLLVLSVAVAVVAPFWAVANGKIAAQEHEWRSLRAAVWDRAAIVALGDTSVAFEPSNAGGATWLCGVVYVWPFVIVYPARCPVEVSARG